VAPGLPALHSDRARVKQILLNLLTNGIKFNRPGGAVTVAAFRAPGPGDGLSVTVADTGRGIAPEALPHIFEKFYRAPAAERTTPGTGLGLAIAQRLAEALGGSLSAGSTPGAGTTFTLQLPLTAPAAGPAAPGASGQP
jgi:two-component system sensor histidine kinase BaeS